MLVLFKVCIRQEPATNHAQSRFRTSLDYAHFYLLLLLLNSLCIKYSMYDVILVRLKRNLFTVFGVSE